MIFHNNIVVENEEDVTYIKEHMHLPSEEERERLKKKYAVYGTLFENYNEENNMNDEDDMLNFVLRNYGNYIKLYLGEDIGASFYVDVDKLFDTCESIKSVLHYGKDFHTTFYADYSLRNPRRITDCVLGTIKDGKNEYKVLKFVTPFTISDTYDFIVFNNKEADRLFDILNDRSKNNNFTYDPDSPIVGLNLGNIKKDTIDFLLNESFRTYCKQHFIKLKRGIILSGLPGTGKSLTLKYLKDIALKNNILFHSFSSPKDFFNNQQEYYDHNPKIFVFEDFDTLLRERDDTGGAPNEVLGSILNTLDGINEIDNVISIFTTNKIGLFDSAFIRPGRIDKVYHYNLPTKEEQLEFFKAYIPEEKEFFEFAINKLQKADADVSFAILKGICDDINILKFSGKVITEADVNFSINNKLVSANKNKAVGDVTKYIL